MKRFELKGAAALITGAAGGIGAELAIALAQHGVDTALVDIDREGLERTRDRIRPHGVSATIHHADLTDQTTISPLIDDVLSQLSRINLLINNAGITVLGRFQDTAPSEFARVMTLNFETPVALTRACLPILMQAAQAQILNISSLFGLIGAPGQTAYCASKFAIRGFSEALRYDLNGTGVGITVAHPGGVRTNIAKSAVVCGSMHAAIDSRAYAERFLKLEPTRAATLLVNAIRYRRRRVIIGRDAKLLCALQRLLPTSHQRLISRAQRYVDTHLLKGTP